MRILVTLLALALVAISIFLLARNPNAQWSGVDESVVEKFARQANREPKPPLIDVMQADLALFAFLIAGTVGGFFCGYFFRELFPPRSKKEAGGNPDV